MTAGILPLAAEQRLLLAAAARRRTSAYTIDYGYRVVGDLDVGRLGAATRRLAAAVPLLRSVLTGSRVLPSGLRVLPEREVFADHGTVDDPAGFLARLAARRVRLTEDPLFEVAVARCGDQHVVSTRWHHAIADAWSVGLCTRWLGELYADTGGPPDAAARWPDHLADEAAALAATDDPGRFWVDQHRGAAFAELLPAGPEPPSGVADVVPLEVAGPGFPERCRAVAATPGAVLLTAALLAASGPANAAGPADAAGPRVLPTMLANREPPYEETVGLLMRTVLLRAEPAPLADVRRGVLRQLGRCWRHRHESLLLLAERSPDAARQLGAGPLPFFAQVLDLPPRELVLAGCATELVHHGIERTARFGVELHLRPRPDGSVAGTFVHDVARYARADVEAAAARYRDCVERVLAC